jgi:hypothetical protein
MSSPNFFLQGLEAAPVAFKMVMSWFRSNNKNNKNEGSAATKKTSPCDLKASLDCLKSMHNHAYISDRGYERMKAGIFHDNGYPDVSTIPDSAFSTGGHCIFESKEQARKNKKR